MHLGMSVLLSIKIVQPLSHQPKQPILFRDGISIRLYPRKSSGDGRDTAHDPGRTSNTPSTHNGTWAPYSRRDADSRKYRSRASTSARFPADSGWCPNTI